MIKKTTFLPARRTSYAPVWHTIVHALHTQTLTSELLKTYVKARMQARTLYWKAAYEAWKLAWQHEIEHNQLSARACKELCDIPLYIVLNNADVFENYLDEVFVLSDKNAQIFYCGKQGRSQARWQEMLNNCNGKMTHGRLSAMYIQDYIKQPHDKSDRFKEYFPYYVLATIEHEITHCEQAANGRVLKNVSGKDTKTIILMTNKGAHECYKKLQAGQIKKLRSSNNFSMESEADKRAVEFHPHVAGFMSICEEQKKIGIEADVKQGYFSNDRFIALSQKMLAAKEDDGDAHVLKRDAQFGAAFLLVKN